MDAYWKHSYFFDQGISFTCQNCGQCCCGAPGIIHVNREDILQIAQFIGKSSDRVLREYIDPYEDHYTIREHSDGCCMFYEAGCLIYPVRPVQCRTYPFWFRNLRSEKNWKQTEKECPGIGQGLLHSKEQILQYLNMDTKWAESSVLVI